MPSFCFLKMHDIVLLFIILITFVYLEKFLLSHQEELHCLKVKNNNSNKTENWYHKANKFFLGGGGGGGFIIAIFVLPKK